MGEYGQIVIKLAKSFVLAVLVVVSFGITHQTASASVEVCSGLGNACTGPEVVCPADFPIKTQISDAQTNITRIVCLSTSEWCAQSGNGCPDSTTTIDRYSSTSSSTTVPSSGASTTTSPSSGGSSSGASTTTSPSIVVARTTTTTTQVDAVEDDGDSEEDFADLGISNKSGKFDMRISSSFVETEMILRAYKKGSKSVTWNFTTNSNGQYRIITSRLLKGFTMSLWIDGEKWDSLVVR